MGIWEFGNLGIWEFGNLGIDYEFLNWLDKKLGFLGIWEYIGNILGELQFILNLDNLGISGNLKIFGQKQSKQTKHDKKVEKGTQKDTKGQKVWIKIVKKYRKGKEIHKTGSENINKIQKQEKITVK